jgi:hypothetical protein
LPVGGQRRREPCAYGVVKAPLCDEEAIRSCPDNELVELGSAAK